MSDEKVIGIIKDSDNNYIWNPWYGCKMISEGCRNCSIAINTCKRNRNIKIKHFGLNGINVEDFINVGEDKTLKIEDNTLPNVKNTSEIVHYNKSQFYVPTRKSRIYSETFGKTVMEYKIPSGSIIKTCNTSDFFLSEADYYRKRAWKQIQERGDCLFKITTKIPENFYRELPDSWTKDGWYNVMVYVSIENQIRAEERIEKLLKLPVRHRGIEIAPLRDYINISKYLSTGKIDDVVIMGETFNGTDTVVCDLEIVKDIAYQCQMYDVGFRFRSTGSKLRADGKIIKVDKKEQEQLAKYYGQFGIDLKQSTFNWMQDISEIESVKRDELASKIYKIVQENKAKETGSKKTRHNKDIEGQLSLDFIT